MKIIRERQVHRGIAYQLSFVWDRARPGCGFGFDCDKNGNVDESKLNPAAAENLRACRTGTVDGKPIYAAGVEELPWSYVEPAIAECEACKGEAEFDNYCGCFVCLQCGAHLGLARCYCGWSASGGNGRRELEEMGETLEEDY